MIIVFKNNLKRMLSFLEKRVGFCVGQELKVIARISGSTQKVNCPDILLLFNNGLMCERAFLKVLSNHQSNISIPEITLSLLLSPRTSTYVEKYFLFSHSLFTYTQPSLYSGDLNCQLIWYSNYAEHPR